MMIPSMIFITGSFYNNKPHNESKETPKARRGGLRVMKKLLGSTKSLIRKHDLVLSKVPLAGAWPSESGSSAGATPVFFQVTAMEI
jgi:hypothetical protein